jgi:beta-lactamase class A
VPIRRSYAARTLPVAVAGALITTLLFTASAASPFGAPGERRVGAWPRDPYPGERAVREAREFAADAAGTVSFAVIDGDGGVRGLDEDDQFSSASVSKVLLLAAELRSLRDEGTELDDGTRSLLESMITYSDNDAASSIYARVGDGGMEAAADLAGMDSFEVTPGYWGGAQVTAADLARFFFRLNRNLVGPDGDDAREMLAEITESQRWGIPQGAPRGWEVYFKGGWRPAGTTETSGSVTHQAALLRHRDGQRVGLAILTDNPPGSTAYSVLSGITRRLLDEPPPPSRWPAP